MFTKISHAMLELIKQDASYLLYLGSVIAAFAAALVIATT